MTLLDIDEAVVYPEEVATDSYGNTVRRPSATGVTVSCLITPNSSSRSVADTDRQGVNAGFSFLSYDAPLGTWSRVIWHGRSMAVSNGPMQVGPVGSITRHIAATLIEER